MPYTKPTVTFRAADNGNIEVALEGPRASRSVFGEFLDLKKRLKSLGLRNQKIYGEWHSYVSPGNALAVIEATRQSGLDMDLTESAVDAMSNASPETVAVAAVETPTARMRLVGGNIEITLGGAYAGPEIFGAFRRACGTCKTTKRDGQFVNLISLADAEPVLDAMRDIDGLAVDVDSEIIAALRTRASKAKDRLAAARERLAAADASLQKKGMNLYPYQYAGVEWLSAQDSAILADDMGLGKTVQALIAAPEGAPILVVCPAVAKGVWVAEAAKWRPDLTPVLLKGRKSFRWPESGEMVITNYEILAPLGDPLPPAPDCVVVIADEAQKIKNPDAGMTKKFRKIADAARAAEGRVWLLTATPIKGKPPELYSMLETINRIPFKGKTEFNEMMGGVLEYIPRVGQVWVWGQGHIDPEVAERLKGPMLRRMKTEVLTDLPPKRYQDIRVDAKALKKATQKQLDEVMRKWDKVTGRPDVLPPFEMLSAALTILAQAKIPAMLELVEEYEDADEPLVVMSAHRAPIDLFIDRPGWGVITGDGAYIDGRRVKDRIEVQHAFQNGDLRGVAATIRAAGVALTLTRAANTLFVDLDWSPSDNAQAEDRIYRIGQKRGVLITRLIADHALDERIMQVLAAKTALITDTVDAASRGSEYDAAPAIAADAERLDALADDLAEQTGEWIEDLEEALEEQEDYQEQIARLVGSVRRDVERQAEENWQRQVAATAKRRRVSFIVEEDGDPDDTRRPALTNIEEWAGGALQELKAMDFDHAAQENFVGFNKADSKIGHALASRVPGGLSALEWALAIAIVAKYWRQIGEMPKFVEPVEQVIVRKIPERGQVGLFDN